MMHKRWVALVLLTTGLFFAPVFCLAAVTGDCSTCHTMHNSEAGQLVAFTFDGTTGDQIADQGHENLLRTDCIGCHSNVGAETIVNLGTEQVPIVFNITEPTYPPDGSPTSTLAGGNFHWMVSNVKTGHNVQGVGGVDGEPLMDAAPGGVPRTGNCRNCHGGLGNLQSGCEGCHVPEHHRGGSAPNSVSAQEQGWYRFLGSVHLKPSPFEPSPEGVVGIEAPDWEQNPSPTQHNVYQGSVGLYSGVLESGTINQKCVGCHGRFHTETLSMGTWIRHPVDVAIPNSGEFVGLTTYEPMVPVVRRNISSADANFSTVVLGSDLVGCVSCHRPHGSPYPSMLRWGYRDWPGTDSHTSQPAYNGCAVCHTNKS